MAKIVNHFENDANNTGYKNENSNFCQVISALVLLTTLTSSYHVVYKTCFISKPKKIVLYLINTQESLV